ncbi:TIGR00162 family protein [Candidatus Methanoperedens nitroreducens]|uniref:TIGR00162 family protein n=1 Tax=Candidatus Methanoperedens nitratireducens TaxID=1392998 RepID=A0A062V885_9EURY|nr:proteasome assembly chaperone family protein [Candidatus Methanoperedens nitroreducens]KCZ71959.1 TIGR00162 family protein [Candidatus Methanoperedens nitroreducens]MDJ1422064.1 proteasome assembly chaperone family protein [Candidatus Methanoperedens sp.]
MIKTTILRTKKPRLKDPILIEGLPGVGHVGKLVAEHMVEELGAKKIIEIYSPHFPPQVIVESDGTIRLVRNEIYAYKSKGKHDLLILVGDHQSTTNEGHYELCSIFLDIAEEFNVKRMYALGGYGVGQLVEIETVLGAANNIELVKELQEHGVEFRANEPGGGIVGASGLLLGLGGLRGIDVACLMGVTSGYLVDPKSAQSVLKVLCKILEIDVDMQALEERASEMEKIVAKLREMEEGKTPVSSDEDLRYIG